MALAFVPKETREGETRVATSPETLKRLVKSGLDVAVERGAGESAGMPDAVLTEAGARLVDGSVWGEADLVMKVAPPTAEEAARLKEGAILVSIVQPSGNLELVGSLRDRKITTLAMDLIPRITRGQAMDVLSSQATVGGYKAVLLGAAHMKKLCPLLMTAAGTVPPAKVVVFGAGVAGLMAIATARRLGCVVEATDVRMAAKEQVESLGGKFIEVPGAEDMEDAGGYAKEQSAEFLQRHSKAGCTVHRLRRWKLLTLLQGLGAFLVHRLDLRLVEEPAEPVLDGHRQDLPVSTRMLDGREDADGCLPHSPRDGPCWSTISPGGITIAGLPWWSGSCRRTMRRR